MNEASGLSESQFRKYSKFRERRRRSFWQKAFCRFLFSRWERGPGWLVFRTKFVIPSSITHVAFSGSETETDQ